MRIERARKITIPFFVILLILAIQTDGNGQVDSVQIWKEALLKSTTLETAIRTGEEIRVFNLRRDRKTFISDAYIFLSAAAQSEFSKQLFYNVFSNLLDASKKKNLETEFALLHLKLEYIADFSKVEVKNQLYYFYAQFYYRIKEYFYSEKYCKLYLKNGAHSLPNNIQADCDLNAMTILAFIDRNKNDLNGALQQLRIILDSSISKNDEAWIGITKGNLAHVLFLQNKFNEAIPYLNEDIRSSLKHKELGSAMNSYIDLKVIYEKLNQSKQSSIYLDSAYQILVQLEKSGQIIEQNYLHEGFEIYSSLANRFYANNDFSNSSKYFAKAIQLYNIQQHEDEESLVKKIINGIEIDRNINQINELNEEIKDKKITLIYFGVITICIFLILIIFLFFYRHLRKANKSLIEKNKIIEHQNLELEKINNDKDRLFSIISHDLRGPSRNLQLVFSAVANKKLPFSSLENQLPNIIKNTTNLVNTLESLLNWSVSQLKGIKVNKILLDVNESVEKNIHFFEDQAQKKKITLINHCYSKMVSIDKNHMDIILRNLTSNAIKFSKQDSTIQFHLIDIGDYVEIFVIDEGTGLTDQQINNILNNTAMKSAVGTIGEKGIGLGLLLTKEFIEINGGILRLKSELNKGTSMSFTIPKSN